MATGSSRDTKRRNVEDMCGSFRMWCLAAHEHDDDEGKDATRADARSAWYAHSKKKRACGKDVGPHETASFAEERKKRKGEGTAEETRE